MWTFLIFKTVLKPSNISWKIWDCLKILEILFLGSMDTMCSHQSFKIVSNLSRLFQRIMMFLERGWPPLSKYSKIHISTQVIRIYWCLFQLLGITWEMGPTPRELFWDQTKFPRGWSPLSEHSKIPISTQLIRIHWWLFRLLAINWEMGPTSREVFWDQKNFSRGWSPLSEHSKIPISTQVIRIHWCLFWLLVRIGY